MKSKDKKQWMDKNKRINDFVTLTVGLEVKQSNGLKGIVVKITNDVIYVWQSEITSYGSDNCEHYSTTNWKSFLRVTNEDFYETLLSDSVPI